MSAERGSTAPIPAAPPGPLGSPGSPAPGGSMAAALADGASELAAAAAARCCSPEPRARRRRRPGRDRGRAGGVRGRGGRPWPQGATGARAAVSRPAEAPSLQNRSARGSCMARLGARQRRKGPSDSPGLPGRGPATPAPRGEGGWGAAESWGRLSASRRSVRGCAPDREASCGLWQPSVISRGAAFPAPRSEMRVRLGSACKHSMARGLLRIRVFSFAKSFQNSCDYKIFGKSEMYKNETMSICIIRCLIYFAFLKSGKVSNF